MKSEHAIILGLAIALIIGGALYMALKGGELATGGAPTTTTIPGDGQQQALVTKEACGDGKPDILTAIGYTDYSYSPKRTTQIAVPYRIYIGGSPSAYISGTSSATAATANADTTFCGDTAEGIYGSSTPHGGYYFASTGIKTLSDSRNKLDILNLKPVGDVSTITFDAPNATGALTATITMDAAGGVSNGEISAILSLNSTSGTFGTPDDAHSAVLMISEFEKGNFSDAKPAAITGWTISSDTVPTNYTNINAGYLTQAWRIDGIKLTPDNTKVKIPIYIKAADGVNPGAVANSTGISLTFYDLSSDLVDGKIVYAFVNQTSKTADIGAPNRASIIIGTTLAGTTGIRVD